LSPKECKLLIQYHKANQNKVTFNDPAGQYNGRRIPLESINNLTVKRIIAKYQYDVCAEVWSERKERIYPEQTEIMRWPIGVPQDMHIDVMARDDGKCTIPFTDFASILYLNDDFEGGETYFEGGEEIKPQEGMVAVFEGMKYWHGVNAATGKDRYTVPIWYTTEWRNMELQDHGGKDRPSDLFRGVIDAGDDDTVRSWWKETYFPHEIKE